MDFQLVCVQRVDRAFTAWEDLIRQLPDAALAAALPAPSNSIGEQLWCLVGARESYTRALVAGGWQGFACSLEAQDLRQCNSVLAGLQQSAGAFRTVAAGLEWTEARISLLLDLLEHENQHQGQMIRYIYALKLDFPESWKQRWSLH